MLDDLPVISAIVEKSKTLSSSRALLVGISGIDAAGKGFVTARVAESLERRGIKPAVITVDGWLNLPHVRFSTRDPAMNFYRRAIRFDQMLEQLVLPLRSQRSIRLEADFTEETATVFRTHCYDFCSIDVILLEGIFLLKSAHRHYFDLTVWIDCSFATALRRAITRGQEKLAPRKTIAAFETIYFPAQRIHFAIDNPVGTADMVLCND